MTGGVFLLYAGLLSTIGAAVLALVALGWPPWAAALVGGLAIGAAGYGLVRLGLTALSPAELVPHQTIETLKEDVRWVQAQTRQRG